MIFLEFITQPTEFVDISRDIIDMNYPSKLCYSN